jgi:hypothetical protein
MRYLVCQSREPIATLESTPAGWSLQYRRDREPRSITPALLPQAEPYLFKTLPSFVAALLPTGARQKASRQLCNTQYADDMIRQHLTVENIGDLTFLPDTVASQCEDEARGEDDAPLGTMRKGSLPGVLAFESHAAMLTFLEKNLACRGICDEALTSTGIAGSYPKAFAVTPNGAWLLKMYEPGMGYDPALAAELEAVTCQYLNEGRTGAETFCKNGVVLSRRFDRDFIHQRPIGVAHLCDMIKTSDTLTGGSWNAVAKRVEENCYLGARGRFEIIRQGMSAWLIGDSDAHLQNFAFIRGETRHGDANWHVAPHYDRLPSRFLTGDSEEVSISISGRKSKLSLSDWLALSPGDERELLAHADQILTELSPQLEDIFRKHGREDLADRCKAWTEKCVTDLERHEPAL